MVRDVLTVLAREKRGMSLAKIARHLHLSPGEKARLGKTLRDLENQGVVLRVKKRYVLRPREEIVRGRFVASPRGFGFVIAEEEHLEDVYVPGEQSRGALHGDVVEVFIRRKGRAGKTEGRVIRILERGSQSLLGMARVEGGQTFFLPFSSPTSQEIAVACPKGKRPETGDIIRVERESLKIREVLGPADAPGVDTRVVIERHNLETGFSAETMEEAEDIPERLSPKDREGREDLAGWRIITIDGENARDFDDAVSIRKTPGGYCLGVHIADVSHYVRPGTAIDRDAFRRGTSVYFPELTLPMLPEKLSNRVCSLRPGEPKLTVSVLMDVDEEGRVTRTRFAPSFIRTAARMTYDSVLRILKRQGGEKGLPRGIVGDLFVMQDAAQRLRARRKAEGSLDFDLTEPELIYREGDLQAVVAFEAHEAHHIIEEFMVAANEAVARYLSSRGVPLVFRVHPRPALEDLGQLRRLLGAFGFSLPEPQNILSRDLQNILEKARGRPEEKFLMLQVLKSLRLAAYSEENRGHYGLARTHYTHFTSPIRRYPDLIVHRILKNTLGLDGGDVPDLASLSRHCSLRERAAEEAERDLVEWRIYRFLKRRCGEDFDGIIVDINRAGLVVELDGYFVDGLVAFSDLGGDYFFRESERRLVGRRSGRSFELGTRVRVSIASVDQMLRRMRFLLAEPAERKRPS